MGVSWLERGDPQGQPVLHFHGWPSSRLEQFAGDDLLRRHGLRWLSLDRPGYGETTFEAEHSFCNWARTIRRWADDQNLQHFHVSGFSGGGPFAQAVAAYLGDRVLSLTLIASLAPFGRDAVQVAPPWSGLRSLILDHTPGLAIFGFSAFTRLRRLSPRMAEKFQLAQFHPLDQKLLDQEATLARIANSYDEATRQGVRHFIADLQLYRAAWDIDHDAIRCPTHVWLGGADTQVPPECSRWLARRIPFATLHEFAGEAHYVALSHANEILNAIRESAQKELPQRPC